MLHETSFKEILFNALQKQREEVEGKKKKKRKGKATY